MSTKGRRGRVLGAAFLLQAMTALAGGILLDFFLLVPGKIGETMTRVAQHPAWMRADILDEMVTAGGVIWLGALLFSKLRRYGETMARVGFALYLLEGAVLAASRIGGFMLLTVSREYADAGRVASMEPLGRVAYAAMDRGQLLMMVPFCAGAFLFYGLLYKSRLVPRWLAFWGLAAMIPVTVATLCEVLGIEISFLLFVPYIPFEFFLGTWILIFGIRDEVNPAMESEPAVAPLTHV
ncbi:MAG: DUF4386 domain-containing protein [Terriglobales bacterium]